MKIAICDDETKSVDIIKDYIEDYSKNKFVSFEKYAFTSAEELLFSGVKFDIAFLDVEMGGMNGIELGKALRAISPKIILIYVTAHPEYLDDALNLGAARYFEKPVDRERLNRSLDDAISKIDAETLFFHLKDGSAVERVFKQDIIYVEIENRKIKIVTKDKTFYSNETMKFWKDKLVGSGFDSPHNSYIVNLSAIVYYKRNGYIIMDGGHNIAISRARGVQFNEDYSRYLKLHR